MGALLHHLPLGHDDDVVRVTDSRQPVGYYHYGPIHSDVVKGFLDNLFGVGIQCTRGFIKEQHAGVGDDAAGNDYTLLLSSGERCSPLTDGSGIALTVREQGIQ